MILPERANPATKPISARSPASEIFLGSTCSSSGNSEVGPVCPQTGNVPADRKRALRAARAADAMLCQFYWPHRESCPYRRGVHSKFARVTLPVLAPDSQQKVIIQAGRKICLPGSGRNRKSQRHGDPSAYQRIDGENDVKPPTLKTNFNTFRNVTMRRVICVCPMQCKFLLRDAAPRRNGEKSQNGNTSLGSVFVNISDMNGSYFLLSNAIKMPFPQIFGRVKFDF